MHNNKARFKVIIIGRRGGKTEFLINETIRLSVKNPGLHWIVGPSYRQVKQIIWQRLKALLKVDIDWQYNEQELSATHRLLNTKIELKGADNEDSLRGVGLASLGVDEASLLKPNVWSEILRPMLADKAAPAVFISTPKGRNWFYDLYLREQTDKEWKSWRHPTLINKYISPQEVDQAKKDMSDRLFRQEFLAEFLDDETGVFKGVRRCFVGEPEAPIQGRFYVMGVDLAKTVDFTVLTVMDTLTRHVVAKARFQDVDWNTQKIKIQELARTYNNALCFVDSTGVGDPIVDDLQHAFVSVEPIKFTNTQKTQLIENLAIAIEQRLITIPHEFEDFLYELSNYEYFLTDAGNIKYGAPAGKHDDCVISLALAVWGMRSHLKQAQVMASLPYADPIDRQGQGEVINPAYQETTYAGY